MQDAKARADNALAGIKPKDAKTREQAAANIEQIILWVIRTGREDK